MKISNKMIMGALWLANYLKPPAGKVEEIYAHARKHNGRQVFKLPNNRRGIVYKDLKIQTQMGSYHCLRMKKKGQIPSRAILYIGGGGGVYNYYQSQLVLARKLFKRVDGEIYYPFYPPATKHPIKEAYRMIFETYKAILNDYSYEKTAVVGLSFGATAAMIMISWNNCYEENLPMPALTIGLSPGHVPANQTERESLEAYRGIDPYITADMVEAYGQIHRGGQELDHWLIHTGHGDFRNAGKIYLYFGEKESLAYAAPIYQQYLEKAGADYKIHIEPGMPHCYGIARINKAARSTYDEYVALINGL
ncbi:MAG TPA: alpha/beta hydrolase [Clostridiales bacterium]|jgi:acetyl esterase/lipase|nr:alpha/beta hydrolase [Clostridiales bacterium]